MRRLLILAVVMCLPVLLWAGESEDVKEVRALIYEEIDSFLEFDQEAVLALYAEDVVGYWAYRRGPAAIEVWVSGIDSLRTKYAIPPTSISGLPL